MGQIVLGMMAVLTIGGVARGIAKAKRYRIADPNRGVVTKRAKNYVSWGDE